MVSPECISWHQYCKRDVFQRSRWWLLNLLTNTSPYHSVLIYHMVKIAETSKEPFQKRFFHMPHLLDIPTVLTILILLFLVFNNWIYFSCPSLFISTDWMNSPLFISTYLFICLFIHLFPIFCSSNISWISWTETFEESWRNWSRLPPSYCWTIPSTWREKEIYYISDNNSSYGQQNSKTSCKRG